MKSYIQFINEKNEGIYQLTSNIADIVSKLYNESNGMYKALIEPTIRKEYNIISKISPEEVFNGEYELWDVYTAKEPFTIETIFNNEPKTKVFDRYHKEVTDANMLKYLQESVLNYEKFVKMNKDFNLNHNISGALSGDVDLEKVMFDAMTLYKSLKWYDFSDELKNKLTEDEKNRLKSIVSMKKFNLYESKSDEINWELCIYKMKKMPAFSREKPSVGRGFYSWDPTWVDGSPDSSIAINKFGPVKYWNGGSEYSKIEDENLIKKIKGSIDFVYDYMFEQEDHNALYNTVRSFFMNYDEDYDSDYSKGWVNLFDYLVDKKQFKVIDEISWKEDEFDGDMETLKRSAKGIIKFGL